ncbi:MAG: DNA damage-inducible protein D, partial [Pedobacter sp.]
MSEILSINAGETPFDQIKHVSSKGVEFWVARELQAALDYSEWDNFENVIRKASLACANAGENVEDHFLETTTKIESGKGAVREIRDYFLTRHACYLIAMNASSAKRVIAEAQTYFAIQTRRQEEHDQIPEDQKRIFLRNRVKAGNNILRQAAHEYGVENFARFQDAGYQGLYNGYGVADLKRLKGVPDRGGILDYMGREELAANEFRITQTEKKLRVDNAQGEVSEVWDSYNMGLITN